MKSKTYPLVSVIIPFVNEEEFLEEAIKSVLEQEYANWELLLVDDGATNNSTKIAKTYSLQYPDKVFYLKHENHVNKGVSASRNLGVEKAKGELVAFLDADDVWLPQKLAHQVSLFQQYSTIGMVVEASMYWHNWNDAEKQNLKVLVGGDNDKVIDPPEIIQNVYPLGKGAPPCPSGIMLRKEAILKVGGFETSFHKELVLYEDQAFLHKIYVNEKVFVSSHCNSMYRQRKGSVVELAHANGNYHRARKYFFEWLHEYFKEKNVREEKVLNLLNKAILPYRSPKTYFIRFVLPGRVKDSLRKSTIWKLGKNLKSMIVNK